MQFLKHVSEIVLDRLVTELHCGRNFLVRQTFRHQRQHSFFLRGKGLSPYRTVLFRPGFNPIQCSLGEGRIEKRLTVEDGTNRSNQQAGVDILENVSVRAGQHGRQNGLIVGIRCKKDDACHGMTSKNIAAGFDP